MEEEKPRDLILNAGIKEEIIEDHDKQVYREVKSEDNLCPVCQKPLETVTNVENIESYEERLLILIAFISLKKIEMHESMLLYNAPCFAICEEHVAEARDSLQKILEEDENVMLVVELIQGESSVERREFNKLVKDFLGIQPEIRRKPKNLAITWCKLCKNKMEKGTIKYLRFDKNPEFDLIWMSALHRGQLSEDDVRNVLWFKSCAICQKHFGETCETLFEILGVQNPDEIQKASIRVVDVAVEKLNLVGQLKQEPVLFNEQSFLKMAVSFASHHWGGKNNEPCRKRPKSLKESHSGECIPSKRINLSEEQLGQASKSSPKSLKCLICDQIPSRDNMTCGWIHREKMFVLLVAVEKGLLTKSHANRIYNTSWSVICLEHLSSAARDLLAILGISSSSEVPNASFSAIDRLWQLAQRIQEGSVVIEFSAERFLENIQNFLLLNLLEQ